MENLVEKLCEKLCGKIVWNNWVEKFIKLQLKFLYKHYNCPVCCGHTVVLHDRFKSNGNTKRWIENGWILSSGISSIRKSLLPVVLACLVLKGNKINKKVRSILILLVGEHSSSPGTCLQAKRSHPEKHNLSFKYIVQKQP